MRRTLESHLRGFDLDDKELEYVAGADHEVVPSDTFEVGRHMVFRLMEKDSFIRFQRKLLLDRAAARRS